MNIQTDEFRSVMGCQVTGVSIVTTQRDRQVLGMTVNSFCSVSLNPPLALICVNQTAYIHDILIDTGIFAINILGAHQQALARCFSKGSDYRYQAFCGASYHPVKTGAPVLDDTQGFLDCRVQNVFPGGDHSIFVGQVEALQAYDCHPLIFYRGRYLPSYPV